MKPAAVLSHVRAIKKMEKITCGNIQFSEESVHELDGKQVIVSIPKADIISITISFGESVEKPVLQFSAGIFMCILGFVIGVWPSIGFILHHVPVEPIVLKPFAFAVPLIFIGIAVIVPIFRKCHYLRVRTSSDERKLPIKGCSLSEVLNAGRSFGYLITEPREP